MPQKPRVFPIRGASLHDRATASTAQIAYEGVARVLVGYVLSLFAVSRRRCPAAVAVGMMIPNRDG